MSMYAESLRAYLKPIVEYLDDVSVSEIMINGPEDVWIERKGRLTKTTVKFTVEGIEAAARNMAQYVGRMLNDEQPRLDARLPDGSRIHVVMPPIARKGCTISIRKFFPDKLTVEKLVEFGSMTPAMSRLIDACVGLKENMVISGGTGSGKTTLLNCVAQFIPDDDRILTIEDSAELQLNQEHLVPFESRPADKYGKGKVDMGDLLHSALRLRPDRIVVGEVRGGEAFHLMQAMNTGHGGSLCTVHANTPTDTLRRLESLCLMAGIDLPMVAVRAQVSSAINVVVCCARLQDGTRKTTHIAEVLPLDEKGDYRTQDLFVFTPTHKDDDGKIHGYHAPTGLIPTFLDQLAPYGFADIDEAFFDPATYDVKPPPVFTASEGYKARWAPSLRHRTKGAPAVEAFEAEEAEAPPPRKAPRAAGPAAPSAAAPAAPSAGASAAPSAAAPAAPPAAALRPPPAPEPPLPTTEGGTRVGGAALRVRPDEDEPAPPRPAKEAPAPRRPTPPPEEHTRRADLAEIEALGRLSRQVDENAEDEVEAALAAAVKGAPPKPDLGEAAPEAPAEEESTDPGAERPEALAAPPAAASSDGLELTEEEAAAIEAALAAEQAASSSPFDSIQLDDDYAREAESAGGIEKTVQRGPDDPAPDSRPRRRKGGVVGTPGK